MLNEKIKINGLTLENRLAQPPMATEKSDNGKVTDALCKHYAERAGYIGLIVVEHAYFSKGGKWSRNQLYSGEGADLEGLKRLAEAIHGKGTTKAFVQINHSGAIAKPEVTGCEAIDINTVTKEELSEIKEQFVKSAVLIKEAGFDGVVIHGAHAYLNCQMYSPLFNKRTDEYTGSTLEGRTKYPCEVIAAVRKAVGNDFPIAYRFGACDYAEGGSTEDEAPIAAKKFVEAGADLIDISGGFCRYTHPTVTEPGWFSSVSEKIKNAVDVPVLLTGGIKTKEDAERLLAEGKADIIGVGREILKNPDWAKEALE